MAEADLFGRRLAIVLGVQHPVEVQKKKLTIGEVIPGHPCALWRVGQAVPPVIGHPEIAGECQPRDFEKHSRADLPQVVQASRVEMLALIERHQLYGSGCAIVDAMILASTLLTPGATLWTLDKRLVALADELGVLYPLARS